MCWDTHDNTDNTNSCAQRGCAWRNYSILRYADPIKVVLVTWDANDATAASAIANALDASAVENLSVLPSRNLSVGLYHGQNPTEAYALRSIRG